MISKNPSSYESNRSVIINYVSYSCECVNVPDDNIKVSTFVLAYFVCLFIC